MKEMNKEEFIREVAKRSHFTIGDIRDIWAVIEEIFADAVRERIVLSLRGFGKLYYTKIRSRKGHDAKRNKPTEFPETEKINFKVSERLRNLLK